MNQTRVFLLFAWLMVATLLYMEWNKEKEAANAPAPVAAATTGNAVPAAIPTAPASTTPNATTTIPGAPISTTATASGSEPVTVTTDVLRLTLDGGRVRSAELLRYPVDAKSGEAGNIQLFDPTPAHYFEAQSGWVSSSGPAPDHLAAFILLRDGVFNAKLRKYEADGDPWQPEWVCFYFINDAAAPSFVVDVSGYYEIKRRALACYRSQFARATGTAETRLNSPGFNQLIESRDAQFGALAGVRYAEGVVTTEPVVRDGLLK